MSIVEETGSLAKMVFDIYSTLSDPQNADSLTKYSKTTSVVSQVYVESKLIEEDIMVPLMGCLNQIYTGYVMTALQLNNLIENYAVVRNALASVTTESFKDIFAEIDSVFSPDATVSVSIEATNLVELEKKVSHLAVGRIVEFDFIIGNTNSTTTGPGKREETSSNKPVTVTVPIHISLLPREVTSAVADAFLTLNFEQSLGRRWKKVKAREITLFRDFLLSRDLVKKYAKAMNEDTTNALQTMFDQNNQSRFKKFKKLLNGNKGSNNIASSIMIFEKRTFERAANEGGFNFERPADRKKFFNAALAMLVVVVDSMYDSVDIYYNGLDKYSTFSFRAIEKSGASKDGIDMKLLMNTLAKGAAPKF